ncbi:MAG: prepilin-type N-terminal cleavage/methylation domain-containing protein [Candidatus Scalinduaceae bacterium]
MMIGKYRNPSAFTLIELIIILVIITISAVICIPRVTTGIESAKFRGAISEVVTFLRNVHLDAVLGQKDISVAVDYTENILKRDDDQIFSLPPEIILRPTEIDGHKTPKYSFFDNGRGTGPRMEIMGGDERMAVVYVDLISGLAKYELR